MPLVGLVLFTCYLFPTAVVGEEGICLSRGVIYLCKTKLVGLVNEVAVKTGTAYYINVLVRLTTLYKCIT